MKISQLHKQPFLTGSILMLLGVNIYNFGQMIFHLVVGRLLGKSGYADVAVLVSVLGIVIIVQQAFGLTIIKFVSASKNEKSVTNFTRWVFWWSLWLGVILSLILLFLSPLLINFLHISQPNVILLLSPTIFLIVFLNTAKSTLQGLLKFKSYVSIHLVEIITKLLLSVVFIYLGWAVFGVMMAIVIGVFCSAALTYFILAKYITGKRSTPPEILPLFKYSVPVFFQSIALTSMLSTDIILVKHFFNAEVAGLYAALAKLGSIAFFGAAPVASVMFPFISRHHSKNEPFAHLFYLSIFLVIIISIPVVLLYKAIPFTVVGWLYGAKFVDGSDILWWFGAYMLLLGIAVLLSQFYLSIGKTKVVYAFAVAAILQIILIILFHETILNVIQASILAVTLLVSTLLLYFPYHKK